MQREHFKRSCVLRSTWCEQNATCNRIKYLKIPFLLGSFKLNFRYNQKMRPLSIDSIIFTHLNIIMKSYIERNILL